ncbi:PREDICTED: uncharacterized protein LOC109156644 [Ipomoea nil]|uniref:uncharacterized protein LOC109156644 n=1 Tax=Ipomoea nil TaxID=35883 RepID=UPI000900B3B6|nr:PREDICTED: uncharacterized protein LOC109156644 [Ipomoea nil]
MATPTAGGEVAGITARWADLVLEEEEVTFVPEQLSAGDHQPDEVETWVLIGRFLTEKTVKVEFMRQVLASVWQPVRGVQVTEVQPKLFMFVFYHYTDIQYVLEGGPWAFQNHTLVCKQLPPGTTPTEIPLDTVELWVQCYDLPFGYTSDKILEQIGNFLGVFVKLDDRFLDAPWLTYYRIRVAIPVDKPVKRRMRMLKRDKTYCWINFRYERLHTFCFYCGMMGHAYRFCLKARNATIPVEQFPYSDDLRAGGIRGPREIGDPWLVPLGGKPKGEKLPPVGRGEQFVRDGQFVNGEGNSGGVKVGDDAMHAVTKRRREMDGGCRGHRGDERVIEGEDIAMTDVQKNLQMAGAAVQTRPTQ